jgi:hypothetical protein
MLAASNSNKPRNVFYAEIALWTWTAWFCLYGILEAWRDIHELQQFVDEQLPGLITIDPDAWFKGAIICYVLITVLLVWIIVEIGKGKRWARTSLLWGVGSEFVTMALPPYHGFLSYIPDIGLQAYAAYLLYTPPGSEWFAAPVKFKK